MTLTQRCRPLELEDLDVASSTGGDEPSELPAWVHEVIAAHDPAVARPASRLELPVVESLVDAALTTDPTSEVEPVEAEERAAVSIAFELGYRAGFEQGRGEGFDAGRHDGRSLGEAEARAELRDSTEQVLGSLRRSIAAQGARLEQVLDEVAAGSMELALGLAEMVLQRELQLASDPGADAIRRAVAALPAARAASTEVVARLHPADVESFVEDSGELLGGSELTILADPHVARGSCVLDAGPTRVDASAAAALARVRAVLLP